LRAVNISQSSYAKRHSTSLSKSEKTPISDAIRLQVISETIESLQTTIKSSNTAALSNVAAISAQMKNERTLLYLIEIADKSKGDAEMIELPTERDFDATVKSALILSALWTRADPNVTVSTLRALEDAEIFSQIKGFFANEQVSKMVDLLIKHYTTLVKKRIVK
jgi:hypothetical protein